MQVHRRVFSLCPACLAHDASPTEVLSTVGVYRHLKYIPLCLLSFPPLHPKLTDRCGYTQPFPMLAETQHPDVQETSTTTSHSGRLAWVPNLTPPRQLRSTASQLNAVVGCRQIGPTPTLLIPLPIPNTISSGTSTDFAQILDSDGRTSMCICSHTTVFV